jgi:hypothetical protein
MSGGNLSGLSSLSILFVPLVDRRQLADGGTVLLIVNVSRLGGFQSTIPQVGPALNRPKGGEFPISQGYPFSSAKCQPLA